MECIAVNLAFSALVAANLLMQVLEGDARPESTASRAAVKTTARLRRAGGEDRARSCMSLLSFVAFE
ncbi:hypothetical protein CN933_11840 [Sinorhizobium sp. M4_45]|nr:hypothetical protein CN933_11840 [Sinorhizobium sp. M4_45]